MELIVNDEIKLISTNTSYSTELFNLIQKNRIYLSEWLPRTEKIKTLEEYKDIIVNLQKRFEETKTGAFVIIYNEKIVGSLDLQLVDKDNSIGGIGYWIDQDFQGKGIITQSAQKIVEYAFHDIKLHKLIIQCVSENKLSIKVAQRLDFEHEATFKQEFLLQGKYHDLERFCLINRNFEII